MWKDLTPTDSIYIQKRLTLWRLTQINAEKENKEAPIMVPEHQEMLNLFGELTEWVIADQAKLFHVENLFNPFPQTGKKAALKLD